MTQMTTHEIAAEAKIVHPGIVGDAGQARHAHFDEGGNAVFRDAAQPEAADGDRLAILDDAGQCGMRIRKHLAHL